MTAYKPRDLGTLKGAVTQLIEYCGGLDRAALMSRVSASSLARYSDPAEATSHIAADVALALEIAAGAPIVSRFMAAEQGFALVPSGAEVMPVERRFADAAASIAGMMSHYAAALADGQISEDERQQLLGDVAKIETQMTNLRRALAGRPTAVAPQGARR